ncbi:MAG: preprotein translocase subunit SecE [Candidatus Latescibacteria bacterium]|nr:preprotein translocase subunit SecE [Candidatus Latescibacterota bacterium]
MAKFIDDSKKFIREVRAEMSKVTWPSWLELKGSTILVIIVSVFFAVYIGAVDVLLSLIRNLWV